MGVTGKFLKHAAWLVAAPNGRLGQPLPICSVHNVEIADNCEADVKWCQTGEEIGIFGPWLPHILLKFFDETLIGGCVAAMLCTGMCCTIDAAKL